MKKGLFALLGAGGLAVTMALAGAAAAHADATGGRGCSNGSQINGVYWTAGGARSSEILGDCGTVQVRVAYTIYPGSPVYYTGWTMGSSTATSPNPGNTQVLSNHDGTYMNGASYFTLTDP